MHLSIRHFTGALLLLVAFANSYGLVESLQSGPCPGERAGWIAGQLIAATFVLYFFAGFWAVIAQKYMVMAILTLWAWHLLVLSPFLATKCSEHRSLDLLRQVMGFGHWHFIFATALLAIASSIALYLRYRLVNGLSIRGQRRFLRLSVAGATVVSIVLAAVAYWIIPLFRETYSSFGADLPTPTRVFFDMYQYFMVIPFVCVVGFLYVWMRDEFSEGQLRFALKGAVGLIVLLNVVSSTLIFSVFAPVMSRCGCV